MDWFAGASMISWHHQHTIGHHVYTNVMGVDPDMPMETKGDLRRLVHQQVWTWMYKFQHIYLPVVYGLLGLKFRVQDITGTYLAKSNGPIRVNFYDSPLIRIWLVKAVFVLWRIVLPLMFLDASNFLGLFIIAELTTGYWLAYNFQVSHVSTIADFPNGDGSDKALDEWAITQVNTSVDYAHDSPFITFLAGALNYQTVHHLFPCVSQYHYPALAPIVKDVCKQYGVKFRYIPTFAQAFTLHIRHLKEMGEQGKAAHID
jgi:fatty acid desaturase